MPQKTFKDKKIRYFEKTKYDRPIMVRQKYMMGDFERDLINRTIDYYNDNNIESDYGVKKIYDNKDMGAYIYEIGDDIIIEPEIKNVIVMVWNKINDLYDKKVSKKENFTHIFRTYEFVSYLDNLIMGYGEKIKLFKVSKKELEKMENDEYDYEANEINEKKKLEEWKNQEW